MMEIEKLIEALRGKCAVCKRSSCNGKYWELSSCPAMCEAATALEQLQAENDRLKEEVQQMQWISVEERLPEPTENPVLIHDYSSVSVAWYSRAMGWVYKTGLACVDVTYWAPLPSAPKEEPNGKK